MLETTGIILAADIGTTSLKASFIDLNGRLLAFKRISYSRIPDDANGTQVWERAFCLVLDSLQAQAPDCPIDALCFSGNGPTLVPLKTGGQALPPLYWFDGRTFLPAGRQASSFFLPQAAWLKKNSPDEYKQTSFFISSHEWLAFRLGAPALTVIPNAAYEPYYWDDEQLRLFELDREKFPPFAEMGSPIGHVSPEAASFFGAFLGNRLKSGTPIIAGGPDFITALIGTGVIRPGEVCDRAGSSEGINVCAAEPPAGDGDIRVLPHFIEGLWNVSVLIPASGKLFQQYRLDTGQEDRPYAELIEELLSQSAGLGPADSSMETGRKLLCDMALAVRSAAEKLRSAGLDVKEMKVSGGQGKNALWNQFKADITGISLVIPEINDGELAGNAVLAAAAIENRGLETSIEKMIRFREKFTPKRETGI